VRRRRRRRRRRRGGMEVRRMEMCRIRGGAIAGSVYIIN